MSLDTNPYQAPDSRLAEPSTGGMGELASKGRRFGTFVVDYIGCTFSGGLFGGIVGLTMGERGAAALEGMGGIVLGVLAFFAYYVFFESLWARTPGKLILGTRVVTLSGDKPGFGQIFKRTACRLIPFEAFSFLGDLGWHDSISDTRVVMAR